MSGRRKGKPEKLPEFGTFFSCPTCQAGFRGSDEFKKHLAEKHGIRELKGSKQLTMHVDASRWFSSDYVLTISGLTFGMHVCLQRTGLNAQMWADHELQENAL